MSQLTIDDAIAAFVACEPGDEAARRRLRERCWVLVSNKQLDAQARTALAAGRALQQRQPIQEAA